MRDIVEQYLERRATMTDEEKAEADERARATALRMFGPDLLARIERGPDP